MCWYGFEYVEKHESTAQKDKIAELEGTVEDLRSKIGDLSNKRNALKRKLLDYFPDSVSCETTPECDGDMVCDTDLGICVGEPNIES
ncbi:MAG: bZIP transcription factor [Promethearchaeota archaeon]